MGGINPNIALATRAPDIQIQTPQPLDQYGKVLTLQNLMQQGQLRQMEAQKNAQDIADRQYKAENLRKFQSLYEQGKPAPTPDDVMRTLGPDGTKVVQEMIANQKEQFANQTAHLGRLSNYASTILNTPGGPTDFTYQYNIKKAMETGDLPTDAGNQMLTHSVNDPQVLEQLRSFQQNAMDAQKQQQYAFDQADNAHKLVTAAATAGKDTQEALQAGLQTFAQGIGRVTGLPADQQPAAWAAALRTAPKDVQNFYAGMNWGPTTAANVQIAGAGKPEPGKTFPLPADVTQQQIETEQGKELAKKAAEMQAYQPIVQAVLSGDQKLQDLDPGTQAKITPGLILGGYQGFGKTISDAEREKLNNYDRALGILKDTQKTLQDQDKRGMMGLIGGTVAQLPWSDAHKDLQSDLVTQQQELKKFITDGSLRNVTPETLNQMFPNIWSQPEHADHQVQKLIDTITTEKGQYVNELAGKVMPSGAKAQPGTAPPAPTSNAPKSGGPANAAPPGKVSVKDPTGKPYYVNASTLNDFLRTHRGWSQ